MSLNSARFDTYQSNRQWELSNDFYKSQNSQSERTWRNLNKKIHRMMKCVIAKIAAGNPKKLALW